MAIDEKVLNIKVLCLVETNKFAFRVISSRNNALPKVPSEMEMVGQSDQTSSKAKNIVAHV